MTLWQHFESDRIAEERRAIKAELAQTKRALRAVNKVPYRRERVWQYGLAMVVIATLLACWCVNWMAKQ